MAKETVTVDNGLEEIELENREKMEKKDKKEKKNKNKDSKPKKEKKIKDSNKQGYFGKVRAEMKLVTWPTKKSVFKYSFASIMMIVLMAAFFLGISALFDLLYALVQGWIG